MTLDAEPTFHRPCWVDIHLNALRANLRALKNRLSPQTGILAVVKADGYGHGLVPSARAALDAGACILGVSSIEEGLALRKAGIESPVLILGSLFPFDSFHTLFTHRLTPTVASLECAQALSDLAQERDEKISVHLKIDSGFGRIGVSWRRAGDFIERVSRLPGLVIEGLYTHFASSDIDEAYTRRQAEYFQRVLLEIEQSDVSPKFIHMANSAATLRFPETHETLVRLGISFYGIDAFPGSQNVLSLTPALSWKSRVVFVKQYPQGEPVSYARTWVAQRPSRIATLAVGYADGYPRMLTNKGQVLIRGQRVPVIGRVTMDMTMVDVTDLDACHAGDEVVLIGSQGDDEIRATEVAEWAATNAYEIVSRIGPRVPRFYHG